MTRVVITYMHMQLACTHIYSHAVNPPSSSDDLFPNTRNKISSATSAPATALVEVVAEVEVVVADLELLPPPWFSMTTDIN